MSTATTARIDHIDHSDLESQVKNLRSFGEKLKEEVIVTPLIDVISRITNLPETLRDLDEKQIHEIQREVDDCKRILDDFGYSYIGRIITRPEQSRVFKIVNQADRFAKGFKKMIGKEIVLDNGEKVLVTESLYKSLTRFKFSIGTPPVTAEGVETIEQMLFGSSLVDLYQFRELLGRDDKIKNLFDAFTANADRLIAQSTHYTTADEKRQFEKKATDFNNFEGLRGLKKSAVSGTAKTAIRLIKEELFSRHQNGSHPVKVMELPDCLDENLIAQMKKEKETIFVVRVSKVPHHILTSDKLDDKWHGILGRLILVDDSQNSRRSGQTFVYSLIPEVTETLDVLHVKNSGTLSNPQMNLRAIIENFSLEGIEFLESRVRAKITEYEARGVHKPLDEVRTKEWLITAQRDYLCLQNFLRFIEFVRNIQTADDRDMAKINNGLIAANEDMAMDYFFKNLKGKGYNITSVPQGGGRMEIGHVGKFFSARFETQLREFKNGSEVKKSPFEAVKERLIRLKRERSISSTQSEADALRTAEIQTRSPLAALRDTNDESGLVKGVRETLRDLGSRGIAEAREKLAELDAALATTTASNLSGRLRAKISAKLGEAGLGSASKLMERGKPKELGLLMRGTLGLLRKHLGDGINGLESALNQIEAQTDFNDLSFAERMLNDIEQGSLKPNLALNEVGWTFEDVLDEDDFPASNYLKISMKEDGEMDAESLEQQLRTIETKLREFPELFELFCRSTLLIVNDPHNPTSRVAKNATKLKLLEIASRYGITVLADDAYHKQISKEIKDEQGDMSLAEFYEINRRRFAQPINIYSTLPTTKWAMGAGERTGVVLTNDQSTINGQTFGEYVKSNTDSVNTMALYMDAQKYAIGLKTKSICAMLEPLILKLSLSSARLAKVIGSILAKRSAGTRSSEYLDLSSPEFCAPLYFALIEARNDLDRLVIRSATPLEINRYISDFVSEIKNFRLDKQTQRDSAKRSKIIHETIQRVAKDHPFLENGAIKPEGPFYVCVKLDDAGPDPSLTPFLTAIASARHIAVVPAKKGYVRFAFGGELDGTSEGYKNLGLAFETDLRMLINYWEKFKTERARLQQIQDLNPELNALKNIFPGGEIDFARTIQEKSTLITQLSSGKEKKRKQLVFDRPANVAGYISSIEPDSQASIVTLREVACRNLREFMASRPFRDLFNHYLVKVKSKVPALQHLEEIDIKAHFGARVFAEREKTRIFKDQEREVFAQIATEIAKIWFSGSTIKILASDKAHGGEEALFGAERMLADNIRAFLDVFLTPEEQKDLLQSFRKVNPAVAEYLPVEFQYPATFQAGYRAIHGLKPNANLPAWSKMMINRGEFAANSTATDRSPNLNTPGKARVPGVDRAILRRDGDGETAPGREFFSERLEKFGEVMNPKDYVMKMIQVGGTKVLLVMNRAYSHYMVEELRLFPQTDLTPEDLENCKPDAVSFLGLPSKVMGEDYRIGYFLDRDSEGNSLPVSWVDAESITDYMGYLKKPILTVANEKVEEKEMLSVHGSAFSIIFKNGLRKTIVMAGDSGTGKSETIIAMIEQIINNQGLAAQVEGIEFLSGDMLSLFEGDDKQLYMLGTEQGDFMRMTDIPADWKKRVRDRINTGSKTNLSDKKNPRITIGNLCDPVEFQKPVRVNSFLNINNFEVPTDSAVRESESPRTLLLDEYVQGYRGEKGTSGDQPNIYASVSKTGHPDQAALINEFGKELDILLGWDILTGESGKAENAFLSFNDLPGGIFKAKNMVRKLFVGKKVDGKEITDVSYAPRENHFYVDLRDENGKTEKVILDREGVFNKIYNPVASTYCGNPFVSPQGRAQKLERFAEIMKQAGVITGTLFTQLKVAGMEFDGPARASQNLLKFLLEDERINARFQMHIRKVDQDLRDKYGAEVLNSSSIPDDVIAHNLALLERHESDNVCPIDSKGSPIHLKTPQYQYNPAAQKQPFNPKLATPEIVAVISDVCENAEYDKFNMGPFSPEIDQYDNILAWDCREELIYQILIKNGLAKLNYKEINIAQIPPQEIKKAEKIAENIIRRRSGMRVPVGK